MSLFWFLAIIFSSFVSAYFSNFMLNVDEVFFEIKINMYIFYLNKV